MITVIIQDKSRVLKPFATTVANAESLFSLLNILESSDQVKAYCVSYMGDRIDNLKSSFGWGDFPKFTTKLEY